MILRKAMLAAAAIALTSSPAWALPGGEHNANGHGNSHTTPPGNSGTKGKGHGHSGEPGGKGSGGSGKAGKHGKSHRCLAHKVGYVASGTLVSDTLTENPDHTYSGEVTVEVTHGNAHARADKGTKKTYTLHDAHLTLAVPDTDKDGVVAVDDLAPGDRVHLTGKVTMLAKHCDAGEFVPQVTIRHVVFHGPREESSSTSTTTSSTTTSTTSSTLTTSSTTSTSTTTS